MQEQHSGQCSDLARQLRAAIHGCNESIEELADRTKVPRTTILAFIEEPVAAVLPERVYLRGHLKVLGQALKLDLDALLDAFDDAYPVAPKKTQDSHAPGAFVPRGLPVSVGLYGIAFVAAVIAFATALS